MSDNLGRQIWQLGFQVSPIILTDGIANSIPGGLLPIIAITEPANFVEGLLGGSADIKLDDFFASYVPLPGTTLQRNEVATYPFANQTVAANSIIAEPLTIAMGMVCPVRNGYWGKLAIMSALQKTLQVHNQSGGLYTIVTPSNIYTGCMMTSMIDQGKGSRTKQAQTDWVLNFIQPLTSFSAAQTVKNALMNILSKQTRQVGQPSWSSLASTVGSPLTLATSSVVTEAKNILGMIGG